MILGVALALTALRFPMILVMKRPEIIWDELIYLSYARFFAGEAGLVNLQPAVSTHFAYGAFIAPAFILHPPLQYAYRAALTINLLYSAVFLGLTYMLARKLGMAQRLAIISAVAVAAYPSFFMIPMVAFTENVVYPMTLAAILAFWRLLEAPSRPLRHVLLIAIVLLLYAAHTATLPTLLVTILALIVGSLIGRFSLPLAAIDVILLGVGFVGINTLDGHFMAISGGYPRGSLSALLLSAVTPSGLLAAVRALFMQQMPLVFTTFSTYSVGVVSLWRDAVRVRTTSGTELIRPAVSLFVLSAAILTVLMSAIAMSGTDHSFHQIGLTFTTRYVEPWLPPILIIGFAALFEHRAFTLRPALYLSALIVIPAIVSSYPIFDPTQFTGPGETINLVAFSAFNRLFGSPGLVAVVAIWLVGCAGLFFVARTRAATAVCLFAIFCAGASIYDWKTEFAASQDRYTRLLGAPVSRLLPYYDALPQYGSFAVDTVGLDGLIFALTQLALPEKTFTVFNSAAGQQPASPVVIASTGWQQKGYRRIACETFDAMCLFVSDPHAAAYLAELADIDVSRPVLALSSGLEIGIDHLDSAVTSGVQGLERTPDGIPFRWTTGDAVFRLPRTDVPARGMTLFAVAPAPGGVSIFFRPAGGREVRLLSTRETMGGNTFSLVFPQAAIPGSSVRIVTTNRIPGGLSVEIRSLRLLPN